MNMMSNVDILYAEDSPADAEMTLRAFARQGLANRLIWVKDGEEALDYLFQRGAYAGRDAGNLPRLILLDLKMPKVDGIEVLRQVKSTPALAGIPVVMLTSSSEESDMIASYYLGADSYIVKPIEFERFMSVVTQVGLHWAVVKNTPDSKPSAC